ncbi:MAG: FMN-binding negative transcriptional regulator [Xanthobacteraceae bacterium]|jgi:transcriptional regulator|nr:FMN-binding negative transcriptional regulator [Xanthobacteraceae bacterium]
MLYNPPAFKETDLPALQAQIAASGLTTLISVGANGPIVSNLPIIFDAAHGQYGIIAGHLARGNPQWRDSDLSIPAIAIFMGADAYVSPSYYPSKQEHGKVVPTWNYSMIVARGRLETFEDADALRAQVVELTKRFEAGFKKPWEVSDAPEDYIQRQIKGIVGVRLHVESIEGKAKLNQNRSSADQEGVVAGLSPSARASDREVAEQMRERLKR